MACTGLVSSEICKFINIKKEFVLNKIDFIDIYSKHNHVQIKADEFVLDRARFDQYLAEKARQAGAEIILNHRFIRLEGHFIVLKDKIHNCTIKLKPESIIGADGPISEVAKASGLLSKREYLIGIQAKIKGSFSPNSYKVYLGSICPGFLAWIVPESEEAARVGIASKKNALMLFKKFLKIKNICEKDIVSKQAGLIPVYNSKIQTQKSNICLVGDAAAQVKATTGGGIIPGLRAAKILAYCLTNNKSYQRALKQLKRELWLHTQARNILNKFSDKEYDRFLELIKGPKTNEIINSSTKDNLAKQIAKIILIQPGFLKYIIKLFA